MSTDVVGLGEAMLRLSTVSGVRLDEATTLHVDVAGSELNVLVALSSLGLRTSWVTALPEGPLGRRVARDARAAGVDLSRVGWVPASRLGLFFAETGVSARPTEVVYDRRDSAFAGWDVDPSGDLDLTGTTYALMSGITPVVSEAGGRAATRFVAAAQRAGARLVIDVNHRTRLSSATFAGVTLEPFLAVADLVVCSRVDAERVLGCGGAPEEAVRAVRERWAPLASRVVLTCGLDGSVGLDGDEVVSAAAVPTEEVDGFGAGDAFVAGLLWASSEGADLAYALRAGSVLAALACTVRGDQARFTAAELTDAMARLSADRREPAGILR